MLREFFKSFYDILKNLTLVFFTAFLIRYFLFQPFIVDGPSMEPNFQDKEYLLIEKTSYYFQKPRRGEVIVFRYPLFPSRIYIKRIIGLPGEKIEISNNTVRINEKILDESYLASEIKTLINNSKNVSFSKLLDENEYFVMGDNRERSSDSREWGVLPKENIVGRSWLAVFPLGQAGFVPRPAVNL